ncbi:MAG TPA: TldD/PmbA family protein [Thermoplasmata archaeon]|nr:TldD/PmbA family protein [Thermoplasmata archaeon]
MEDLAQYTIDCASKLDAEFVDLRIESTIGTSIVVMDGMTRTVTTQIESGCGVRAFVGGAWGFAVTNGLERTDLHAVAESAVKMAKVAQSRAKVRFEIEPGRTVSRRDTYPCRIIPSEVRVEDKLLSALDSDMSMRSHPGGIVSTNSRYEDLEGVRIVANSFGSLVRTEERWTLAACSAWAKADSVMQRGHAAIGNVGGYELMETEEAAKLGTTAAEQAVRLLDSKPAPAGKFTCVLDNKMTGLLAHEAFGHACEADAILSSSSVLEGRVGESVADESVTLIDDPTIEGTFGYFPCDWEGIVSQKNTLIERGVLKGFLHNIETSSRMGVVPSGSSRAEAYNTPPIVRMSNTYIGKGDRKKDEMIEDLKSGMLIQGAQYGYVEPAKGQFMFKCDEAYEIQNGELGQRYRDASLSGEILVVLKKVVGVADDFMLGDPGYCGKAGQSARTTDGGPHICISDVVVGGLS